MPAPAPADAHVSPETRPVGRRRWPRVLIAVASVLLVVAATVVGVGTVIVRRFDHAVDRATLLQPESRVEAPGAAVHTPVVGPLNFLLLGSDFRTDDPDGGQRSDTIIVAHVPAALDRVFLVSIPRDLLVTIPPSEALGFAGDRTKINAAFQYGRGGFGGAQLVSATLTHLIGVRFDGALAVDFGGMVHVVDLLGGVHLCVDTPVVSIHTDRPFEVGCSTMSADVVLDYLRQRDFPDGDFTRQRHQQQFLRAIFDQVLAAGTLTNPVRLDSLLQSVASAMTVDLGAYTLPDLIVALRGLGPGDLTGVRVPYYFQTIGDLAFVIASDEAEGLWAAMRDDTLDDWTAANPSWVNPT